MSVLRIFSYMPNPRVWKATIAARLGGVEVEVLGARPSELAGWLWDFDARPLSEAERTPDSPYARGARRGFSGTLFKTDAFLAAQPFGTVPAAFSPDGAVGIFESNSILRAVARAAGDHMPGLYGHNSYDASRIDSFLDADLIFGREAQVYLLALQSGDLNTQTHARMASACEFFLAGVEAALGSHDYLAGNHLSIADIAFVRDFAQFRRERFFAEKLAQKHLAPIVDAATRDVYPRVYGHFHALSQQPDFAEDLAGYVAELEDL